MSSRTLKIWLFSTLLVSLILAPFLMRGNQAQETMLRNHSAQIARMSDSQRARILQNELQYKAASPEAKAALHTLHAALEKDRQQGSGNLTQVLQRYDSWLKTVEPYQREQLANARQPAERIALMKEIVRSERVRTARRNAPFFGPGGGDPQRRDRMLVLDEKSLNAVMQKLDELSAPKLSEEQKKELQELQGFKRHIRLLRFLKDSYGSDARPLLENPPEEIRTIAGEIDQYVDDPRILNFIQSRGNFADGGPGRGPSSPPDRPQPSPPPTPPAEVRLTELLSWTLMVELFKLRLAEQQRTDAASLQAYFDTLPQEQQFEMLELEASDFQLVLRNLYLDSVGLKGLPSTQDLAELFGRGFMRGGPGRPPFGGFRDFRENRGPRGPGSPSGRRDNEPGQEPGPPPVPEEPGQQASPENESVEVSKE